MKNKYIISFLFSLVLTLPSHAQSAAVQKAAKSVFTLTTYKEDGSILAVTRGVYLGNASEGISSFKPFIGAYSASVIDATGKKTDVETIIGANDIYDICRFTLAKSVGVPLQAAAATATGTVWALGYGVKSAEITPLTVKSSEKFLGSYDYYVFKEEIKEDLDGCPIVNAAGQVIGLVQQASSSYDIHSTDSRYYSTLTGTGLAAHDAVLQKTNIRIALPEDHEQAKLMLLMITAADDSLKATRTAGDYIARYPNDVDGYSALAVYESEHGNLVRASEAMETATKKATAKDEAYYEYAKLIFNTAVGAGDPASPWTLDKAEETIDKAISVRNEATYRHLKAQIKFMKQDYATALTMFDELSTSEISNSEIYYEAAQCKSGLGAEKTEVLDYLNKAVDASPQPLTKISAPYILARGMMLDEMGEYRKAITDYNTYDTLMYLRADADFYYVRGKCEDKARQYQQAINDFAHAAVINPGEVTYLAELAALQLKVGHFEEAIRTCDLSMYVTTEYSDIYIVKGLAEHNLGKDQEAKESLLKAKELGDTRADSYIEKYGL